MDVVKVDRDVSYVTMFIHVYCNRLFLIFHHCFQTFIVSTFIWMLHLFSHICCKCFYLNVVYICKVFQVSFRCFFFKCFTSMFKVFHLSSNVCCKHCIYILKNRLSIAHGTPVESERGCEGSPRTIWWRERRLGGASPVWACGVLARARVWSAAHTGNGVQRKHRNVRTLTLPI